SGARDSSGFATGWRRSAAGSRSRARRARAQHCTCGSQSPTPTPTRRQDLVSTDRPRGIMLDRPITTYTRRELVLRGSYALAAATPLVSTLARPVTASAGRPTSSCVLGAFANPENARLTFAEAQEVSAAREKLIRRPLRIVSTYVAWDEPFPNEGHALDRDAGRTPLRAWDRRSDLSAITGGSQDSLLRARARDCRAFGAPVHLRWASEFNAEWNPCYGRPRGFAAAWRHIVT